MLRHLFKIASRNLLKHLNYSILNIAGLALGITSFAFIAIYISDEMSYDRFHENHKQIYRMNRLYNSNDIHEDAATCSVPFGPALAEDYPDMVKSVVRFFDYQVSELLFENREDTLNIIKFNEEWYYLADSTVFEMFDFPLIEGDPRTALIHPGSIVLSESTAQRYFGSDSALGRTLNIEEGPALTITGIMKDLPAQSHFKIDILGSMSSFTFNLQQESWIWNPCWTYVQLHENINPEQLEARMPDFYLAHYPEFQDQEITLYLQALTDIHLNSAHEYEMHPNSNIVYVKILGLIGIFVLILACINFMNLATASSSGRTREIGMKKAIGARRRQLVLQFLGEAFIMTFVAMILSGILVELLLPAFNNFAGKQIDTGVIIEPYSFLFAAFLLVIVGSLSGFYPAIYLSRLNTIQLKDPDPIKKGRGTGRKVLVVFQFVISIALIIGSITAYAQLSYLRNADLGFNRDRVVLVPLKFNTALQFEVISQELKKHPDIEHVTGMEDILGANHNTRSFVIEGMFDDQAFWYPAFLVRDEFIETFDIEVVKGRAFNIDSFPSDTSEAIMINESMAAHLGWTNEEAIGKAIRSDGNERVIGVFGDFNALSLHKPASNFVLDLLQNPNGAAALTRYMAIRVKSDNYKSALKHIQRTWDVHAPTRPFEYSFLDEELNSLYTDEEKFSKLSLIITILAIVIACLGLIGLTSFMVGRKTREISIRRAHGANLGHVSNILSREFLWLIMIANLLSWPLAWIGLNRWLNSFSKHIDIHWAVFLFSALITVMITVLITTIFAFRASRANPAEILKYE